MDRKAIAKETLRIIERGWYDSKSGRVDISKAQKDSIERSILITPKEGEEWARRESCLGIKPVKCKVINIDTVRCVREMAEMEKVGVLNFASAKNPGGGFLNGAIAQEEALAAASGLYQTLTKHPEYYEANRKCQTMSYTDHAIYSPDVVFFRDEKGDLLEKSVTASVLTMPAVNLGQVRLKGEDEKKAKQVMKSRMRKILGIFLKQGDRNLIFGAYGCGVFRNDPKEIAEWWKELLEENYRYAFEEIRFAVYDRSKDQNCIKAFMKYFPE